MGWVVSKPERRGSRYDQVMGEAAALHVYGRFAVPGAIKPFGQQEGVRGEKVDLTL